MHSLFCQEGREKVISAGGIEAATASIIRRYPRIFQVGVFFVFGFAMFASFRKDPGWHECESQKRRVRRLWGKLETGRREPQKLRSTTVARSCRCCHLRAWEAWLQGLCKHGYFGQRKPNRCGPLVFSIFACKAHAWVVSIKPCFRLQFVQQSQQFWKWVSSWVSCSNCHQARIAKHNGAKHIVRVRLSESM